MKIELELRIRVAGGRTQRVVVEAVQETIEGPGWLRFCPIRGSSQGERLGSPQEVDMDEIEVLDTRFRTDGRTTLARLFEVYEALLDQGYAVSYSGGGAAPFVLWIELAGGEIALADVMTGEDGYPEWWASVYASADAAGAGESPLSGRDMLPVRLTESATQDAAALCDRLRPAKRP